MKYTRKYNSPIGLLTLASDGDSLTGLWIEGQAYFPKIDQTVLKKDDLPIFHETISWLETYFQGENPGFIP